MVEVLNEEVAADLEDVAEVGEVLQGDWWDVSYHVPMGTSHGLIQIITLGTYSIKS